jgi:hypothetical protein
VSVPFRPLTLLLALFAALALPSAAQAKVTYGIGDQTPAMFDNPLFQAVPFKVVRYIPPYDAMKHPDDAAIAAEWIGKARAQGKRVLIAFNYSRKTPKKLPSTAEYTKWTKRFFQVFGKQVESWQPFNEANRAYLPRQYRSLTYRTPTAKQAAAYYDAFRTKVCTSSRCRIVGIDVLDGPDKKVKATVQYIKDFRAAVKKQPKLWGIHNYSDTERGGSSRTEAMVKAFGPGQVWVTETGGIRKLCGASGRCSVDNDDAGQARAIDRAFKIANKVKRITRLYLYEWTATESADRFDAGIIRPDGSAGKPYDTVRKYVK